MKKFSAIMLAVVMLFSTGLTIAFAEHYPDNVNPAQRGHIAYLDATYGTKKADRILEGYGRPSTQKTQENTGVYVPPQRVGSNAVIIPQPGSNTPDWSNMYIGQYFRVNGQDYVVARFTTVTNARAMVAYPVMPNGQIVDTAPRYFYI